MFSSLWPTPIAQLVRLKTKKTPSIVILTRSINARSGYMISTAMTAQIAGGVINDTNAEGVAMICDESMIDDTVRLPTES